jgi:glycosyltransferase involved in cell wall biosynthesis
MPNYVFDAGFGRKIRNFCDAPPRLAMLLNGWGTIKNPQCGMLAMAILAKTYPGAKMHLFGPGFGAGESAQRWAEEQGIGDLFICHGRIPHTQAMRELAEMDLLIHPAVEESFGMTIAEAMALGIPLVAGNSSGAVSWVSGDGAAGRLVDVRSPQAIADAALHLLGDEDHYRGCSARGRARAVEFFSAAGVVAAYLSRYREVLNAPTAVRAGRRTAS